MKNIRHRISIQTLLFQACLPTRQNGVVNRDMAYLVVLTWDYTCTFYFFIMLTWVGKAFIYF